MKTEQKIKTEGIIFKKQVVITEEVSDGWEKVGQTGRVEWNWRYDERQKCNVGTVQTLIDFRVHDECGQILEVGKEFNSVFIYCPLCLVKIPPVTNPL